MPRCRLQAGGLQVRNPTFSVCWGRGGREGPTQDGFESEHTEKTEERGGAEQEAGRAGTSHWSLRPNECNAGVAINHSRVKNSKQTKTHKRTSSCRTEEEVWQKDARQTPPGREQDGLWSVSLKVWLWTKTKVRKPLSCTILLDTFQIQDFNKVLWCSGSWVLMFFSSAGLSWCWGGDCTVKHFLSQTFTPEILLDRDSLQVLHQEQWLFFWTGFRGRIQFVFFGTFSFWPVWITASFLVLWCCCSSLTAAAAGGGGVGVGGSVCFNPNSNPSIKHQILVWIWTIFFQISSN